MEGSPDLNKQETLAELEKRVEEIDKEIIGLDEQSADGRLRTKELIREKTDLMKKIAGVKGEHVADDDTDKNIPE